MTLCFVRPFADDARWTTALVCLLISCLVAVPCPAAGQESPVRTLVYAEAPAREAEDGTMELKLDLYRPADTTGTLRPGVILMHGGGFDGGRRDLPENRQVATALASRGYAVASISYRLWPDRPVISDWAQDLADRVSNMGHEGVEQRKAIYGDEWTRAVGAAAEDMLRALEWMRERGPEVGVDPDRIALAGMSAGALTSVEIAYRLERFGVDVPPVSAVVAVRGAQPYVPEGAPDPVSPGPPLFIVHGTEDLGIPIGAVVRLYREAQKVGVPVEFHPLAGVDHDDREMGGDGMLQMRLDDGSLLVDRLDRFLGAAFDDPASLAPAVCVGAGEACPGEGPEGARSGSGGDEGREITASLSREIADRAASLLESVGDEPGFVEDLYGYSRADELLLDFDDPARRDWSYWPRSRAGLALGRMTADQRGLVHDLLAAHLSGLGYLKVGHVMRLEDVLAPRETVGFARGAERYTVSVFGSPRSAEPWGWRFEGHHVSLNVTLADREVRVTPTFLGASPAELNSGPHAGFRPLRYERELARRLFLTLGPDLRSRALLADSSPGDILSTQFRKERSRWDAWQSLVRPEGAPVAEFDARQRDLLGRLLDQIVGVYRPGIAGANMDGVDLDELSFAWMGSREPGAPQYFRIQGPDFVYEFDASQEGGNHVHTVWREPDRDFGEDLLRRHYAGHEH